MFSRINSLISQVPQRRNVSPAFIALHVRQVAKDVFRKECGDLPDEVLSQLKPSVFKNRTLTVVAPRLLATELKMRSEALINAINLAVGKKIVVSLKFRSH